MCGVIVDFIPLTFCTSFDILQYISLQSWPPVAPLYEVGCSLDAQVSIHLGVMVFLYNGPFIVHSSSNHLSCILIPSPFYQAQIMGTHPGFEHVGVLSVHWIHRFHFAHGNFSGGIWCRLDGDGSYKYMFQMDSHHLVVIFSLMVVWSLG